MKQPPGDNPAAVDKLLERFEQNFLVFKSRVLAGIYARMTPEEKDITTAENILKAEYSDSMLKHHFATLPVSDDFWKCNISTWSAEKMEEHTKVCVDAALRVVWLNSRSGIDF